MAGLPPAEPAGAAGTARLREAVDGAVRDHCLRIDEQLRGAEHRVGANQLRYRFSACWILPGLPRDLNEAQLLILEPVLRRYGDAGYTAHLEVINRDCVDLVLEWTVAIPEKEKRLMSEYVRARVARRP